MKNSFILVLCMLTTSSFAQKSIGIFKSGKDIGSPKQAGHASYDESSQTYTLSGSGYNI